MQSPYEMLLDTPERKAWAAAEALTLYLRSEGVQSVYHLPMKEICPGVFFPKDVVLITIGSQEPVDFRWFELEEERREKKEHEPASTRATSK